jgi:hypothetical protein
MVAGRRPITARTEAQLREIAAAAERDLAIRAEVRPAVKAFEAKRFKTLESAAAALQAWTESFPADRRIAALRELQRRPAADLGALALEARVGAARLWEPGMLGVLHEIGRRGDAIALALANEIRRLSGFHPATVAELQRFEEQVAGAATMLRGWLRWSGIGQEAAATKQTAAPKARPMRTAKARAKGRRAQRSKGR